LGARRVRTGQTAMIRLRWLEGSWRRW